MRDSFVSSLLVEAQKDPNIILITGDLGYGVLDQFQKLLPNQFINAGIAEQMMVGLAAGIASTGKRVFVYSIGNFPTLRCLEQIRNDVCLMNNSVVIVSVGAGYSYGSQGYSHHALEDVSCLRSMPNLEVIAPSGPGETIQITNYLAHSTTPAYLRLGRSKELDLHQKVLDFEDFSFVEILGGEAGSILFNGSIGTIALQAAQELRKMDINIGVYSIPFISHINKHQLAELALRGPLLTLEEHTVSGGFGSAILEELNSLEIMQKVKVLGASRQELSLIGDQNFLRNANGINAQNIIQYFHGFE
jgi:transketolase